MKNQKASQRFRYLLWLPVLCYLLAVFFLPSFSELRYHFWAWMAVGFYVLLVIFLQGLISGKTADPTIDSEKAAKEGKIAQEQIRERFRWHW